MISQPRSSRVGVRFLTLSGPSGAGKGSLVERLLQRYPEIARLTCYTNRAPRPGEVDGDQWRFVATSTIDDLHRDGLILSRRENYGNVYATPFPPANLSTPVIFEADLENLDDFTRAGVDVFRVLILPPSWEEARRRMAHRSRTTERELDERLRDGYPFAQRAHDFDAVLINEDFERTFLELSTLAEMLFATSADVMRCVETLQREAIAATMPSNLGAP